MKSWWLGWAIVVGLGLGGSARGAAEGESMRQQAKRLQAEGNVKEAFEVYERYFFAPGTDPRWVAEDLGDAVSCLVSIQREDETDALRERVASRYPSSWRALRAVARSYLQANHFGYFIAGEFERGYHRGGGEPANAVERDRVRALQLMEKAMPLADAEPDRGAAAEYYFDFAAMVLDGRTDRQAWKLTALTDTSTLPDYEKGYPYTWSQPSSRGAPVDESGRPVFHRLPDAYAAAATDGERWRWLLATAPETDPSFHARGQWALADFLYGQFGVQTMAEWNWWFYRASSDSGADRERDTSGAWELHTLDDTETIAKLATGIRRFTLPDEFNYLRMYQALARGDGGTSDENALHRLAEIYSNRRQYPRAADFWRRSIEDHGPGGDRWKAKKLDQIVGNWGQFEPTSSQPAGRGAVLDYRFRNGAQVHFEAHRLRMDRLLDDIRSYLEGNPKHLDWQRIQIENIGWRLVHENEGEYRGERVAAWELALDPAPNHFDRRVTVATPLQEPGAYLVTARMADGNTCAVVEWVNDTVIVKKPLAAAEDIDGPVLYLVADAVDGSPIEGANLEFFGYWHEYASGRWGRQTAELRTRRFAEFTDADGLVIPHADDLLPSPDRRAAWLAIARTEQGRFAFHGFSAVWTSPAVDQRYRQTKAYLVTDRPVYRPDQDVRFHGWIRTAHFDVERDESFADRPYTLRIRNPRGDEVFQETLTTDGYGGLSGSHRLPPDCPLGVYHLQVDGFPGLTFRVEEYKKPEFEVEIEAPDEPVRLGDRFDATIRARYYFGAPVVRARVKYKIIRTPHRAEWFPPRPWDWLYGPGYGWFAYDYAWYPGWSDWGCARPRPWWEPYDPTPPEVVAEGEAEIGADGTYRVELDTAAALAMYGDRDHRYQVAAEVTDASRRTIVGSGQVIVARKPFQVTVWVDRGYYRVGDPVEARFTARTPDGRPVAGAAEVTLYRITYSAATRDATAEGAESDHQRRVPVETAVQTWPLRLDDEGGARLPFTASEAGQYRLSCRVTDARERTGEGGYVFTVRGQGDDASDFRFNDLELVPRQAEVQPGEDLQLMINTDQRDSAVLLFVRPADGAYPRPRVVRLNGRSAVESIAVRQGDMPNFFVEALTIHQGRVFVEARRIAVPPEQRVLNVEVRPSEAAYRPGQDARVQVKLTDLDGRPFRGSTVLTVYDEAVEYISGGSNVPDIKSFFWKWQRGHHPRTEHNLDRRSGNLTPRGRDAMQPIGIFGHSVADELAAQEGAIGSARQRMKTGAIPPAPMAARAMAAADEATSGAAPEMALQEAASPAPAEEAAEPTVRREFADTAFWTAGLVTDEDGTVEVVFPMPENLTGWRIRTWALGAGTRVGEGAADVVTVKNLLLRMQAPRFFVETDEVVLSANVHNYFAEDKPVRAVLELDGGTLELLDHAERRITVEAGGEQRVDWRVRARREGDAVVRMKALSDEESDAMEMTFPVFVHGMLKTESWSAALRPDQTETTLAVRVPAERRPEQTRLEVRFSPTLAGALVDALPYLADYPYGCTEQTLSRFLPTVITHKILLDMGLDLEAIREKRTNLNPQEIGDDAERAAQWRRGDRNPVFDTAEVERMAKEGLQALYEFQLSDGGWGWFSGWGERSSAHTTAYVVHGLQLAEANGLALVPGVLANGVDWLKRHQREQVSRIRDEKNGKDRADNLDAFVFMVLTDAGDTNDAMREFLYRDRTHLAAYAQAMLGLALDRLGRTDERDMIIRNLEQRLVEDPENQTAYLNLQNGGYWWYWYGSEYEAQATYLKLLARTAPRSAKAAGLVKYLLNNRKHATYWNSTRDTAICVEAMADYLRASGEDRPDLELEILVDGEIRKQVRITPENLFRFDNRLILDGAKLEAGEHEVTLRKRGTGPLYANAYLTNFTLEDPITRAGLEIKVNRRFYRLVEVDQQADVRDARGQAVRRQVETYRRAPLENPDEVRSGDLLEVELEIESKNDYEYLVFEDFKPAGCEPVDVRSGYTGNALGAYVEYRDEKVAFFVSRLARGRHSVAYRVRAEVPGRFSALPTRAYAMYAPELRANSDEWTLRIEDPD